VKRFSGDFTTFWQRSNRKSIIRIELHGSQLCEKAVIQLHQQIQAKNKALIRNKVEHKSQI
jgi:hypothetical protein